MYEKNLTDSQARKVFSALIVSAVNTRMAMDRCISEDMPLMAGAYASDIVKIYRALSHVEYAPQPFPCEDGWE